MSKLYGMQRANGDWFALQARTTFRVPVFRTSNDALHARAFNPEMLLFTPMILDKRALKVLAAELNGDSAHFWLVDEGQGNLKRGYQIQYGQVAVLCHEDSLQNVDVKSASSNPAGIWFENGLKPKGGK